MTSFQIGLRPNRRAAARFMSHVRRTLQRAFIEEKMSKGITQSDIARTLDIHRSIISRELQGRRDISIGRLAEYAWALGREINFDLPEPSTAHGDNKPANVGFVQNKKWRASTTPVTPVELKYSVAK